MKRFLFLSSWIIFFVIINNPIGYSKKSISIKQSIETTNKAYFTDIKEQQKAGASHNESICSDFPIRNNYSPQTDTTKKKITQPNKGLGQAIPQKIVTQEIDGLLLDATFSPGGYDFYIDFSQNWTPPVNATNYKIVVKEYRGRGTNMVVAIEINDKQLVYRRMRPIYPAIHGLAVAAANYLNGYITRGDHLRGIDADGNFIDVQQNDVPSGLRKKLAAVNILQFLSFVEPFELPF